MSNAKPRSSRQDQYPNIITAQLTMTAANTISNLDVNLGLNIFDKAGLIIERIEYELGTAAIEEMTTSGDDIQAALGNDDTITGINSNDRSVIDSVKIHRFDLGTAASGIINNPTVTHDFSTLGGGGLLVAPAPLFWIATSNGLASAATVRFRMLFRILRLTDAQYLELLETRRAFS